VAALPFEPAIIRTMGIITKDKHTLPLASREFIRYLMEQKDRLL